MIRPRFLVVDDDGTAVSVSAVRVVGASAAGVAIYDDHPDDVWTVVAPGATEADYRLAAAGVVRWMVESDDGVLDVPVLVEQIVDASGDDPAMTEALLGGGFPSSGEATARFVSDVENAAVRVATNAAEAEPAPKPVGGVDPVLGESGEIVGG